MQGWAWRQKSCSESPGYCLLAEWPGPSFLFIHSLCPFLLHRRNTVHCELAKVTHWGDLDLGEWRWRQQGLEVGYKAVSKALQSRVTAKSAKGPEWRAGRCWAASRRIHALQVGRQPPLWGGREAWQGMTGHCPAVWPQDSDNVGTPSYAVRPRALGRALDAVSRAVVLTKLSVRSLLAAGHSRGVTQCNQCTVDSGASVWTWEGLERWDGLGRKGNGENAEPHPFWIFFQPALIQTCI